MRLQQGLDGLSESNDIGVVTHQFDFSFWLADDFNHIDCAYLCGVTIEFIQKRNHLFFVRDGDIEAAQVGILFDHFHEVIDTGNLEIHILCIDSFGFELLIKVSDRK